ncbi:MAG: hypothetical protein ACR2NU_11220, partial [Aeoliella sp.]
SISTESPPPHRVLRTAMDDVIASIGSLAFSVAFLVVMIAAAANILRRAGYTPWYVIGALVLRQL